MNSMRQTEQHEQQIKYDERNKIITTARTTTNKYATIV